MTMRAAIAGLVFSGLSGLAPLAAGQVVVLPTPFNSNITGISDDGTRVAGGIGGSPSGYYFWDATSGYTRVTQTASFASPWPLLSGNGQALVGVSNQAGSIGRGFIATDSGSISYLPLSVPGQVNQSVPTGISRDGSVVSGWDTHTSSSIQVGWRWSASGGMQVLPFRVAGAMSGDGSTIFSLNDSPTRVWRNGTITTLPVGSGAISTVNYDGSVYAGVNTLGLTIWHHDVPTGVPMLPGMAIGSFTDVDETGSVAVGTMSTGAGTPAPFIWTPAGGTQPLGAYFASQGFDLSAYRILDVHVSEDGTAFGLRASSIADGLNRSILVTVPSPGTLILGLSLFGFRRRR